MTTLSALLVRACGALLFAMAATAAAAPQAPARPATPAQWRDVASADIQAAYQITLDNHPGTYDPANPAFAGNLARAREVGVGLAAQVVDAAGYIAALQRFNTLIHDGHAGVAVTLPGEWLAWRWPGFVAAWRGDAMIVFATEASSESAVPPVGARIDECDGKPIAQLVQANVFAYTGRGEERGNWWSEARDLFADKGNPFIVLPKQCTFSLAGQRTTQALTWRPITADMIRWRDESYNGDTLAVGLSEPRAKLYWMAMPTFQPDDAQREIYRGIYREVREHRQRYLDADALVIDLRHNQGGSSQWSLDFARALWGDDRVQRRERVRGPSQQVWWRASVDNVAYLSHIVGVLDEQKQTELAIGVRQIGAQMQAAQTRGDKYWIGGQADAVVTAADRADNLPADPPAFTKPVYVIVPGQCASACLDALDYFTLFPNVKLIGAPSSADSTYMEVRLQPLASGLASVVVPVKMYVGRPRAAGQIYTPAIEVDDLDWSTQTFLKTIEADLARH